MHIGFYTIEIDRISKVFSKLCFDQEQNFVQKKYALTKKKICPEKLRPKKISSNKFGQNLVINSWDIADK